MSDTKPASPLGSVWEIPAKGDVTVARPDGSTATVRSNGKVAGHVLDVAGTYTAQVGVKTLAVEAD